MKNNFDRNQRATLVAALVLAVGLAGGAQAATETWDGHNGTGIWNTTGNNWSGLAVEPPWNAQGNDAVFNTAGNQVTVNANIFVDNWSIGASGNRVTVDAGQTNTENFANAKFFIYGIGHTSTADGNLLTINGTFNFGGYLLGGTDAFRLGSDNLGNPDSGSSYNGIVVSSSGTLNHVNGGGGTHNGEVGSDAGANCNYMDINGGTFDRGDNQQFSVGVKGSYNYMTIRNGGKFTGGVGMPTLWSTINNNKAERELHIGSGVGGSFNHVDVTGQNAAAYVVELLTVGNATNATDNYLKVENGGNFYGAFLTYGGLIGGVNGANDNYVRVTGSTSALNLLNRGGGNLRRLTIGAVGTTANNNHLDVYNGATATLICGVILAGSNSKFNLGDGTGTSTAYIGNTSVSPLVNLSVATAQLIFDGGKLVSRVTGIPLVIGPGTVNLNGPATIDTTNYINSIDSVITGTGSLTITNFGAGTLTLSASNIYSGDTIISGGTLALSGIGSITNTRSVTIASSATFSIAGISGDTYSLSGSSSQQTLASSSSSGTASVAATRKTLSLASGALATFKAVGGGSPTVGKISVTGTGANLTLNANAVTVDVSGSALGVGTYTLMDCTGILGSTSPFGTPTITGSGLASGKVASLKVTTGALGKLELQVTTPLVLGKDTILLGAQTNVPQALLIIGNLKYPPTGDSMIVSAVTQGTRGSVAISGDFNSVIYTGISLGSDSFTYTISDGHGGTAIGTVNVTVSEVVNQRYGSISFSSQAVAITFWGVPGVSYTIQRSTDNMVTWNDQATVAANNSQPLGQITFSETAPSSGSGYYRIKP